MMITVNMLANMISQYSWGAKGLWLKDPHNLHNKCRAGRNPKDLIPKLYGGHREPPGVQS
jgi:hypothetical protein